MPRKYGLALAPLKAQERSLLLRFLNEKMTPRQLLDTARRNMEKHAGRKRRKRRTGPSAEIVTNLPGFVDRTEKARKTWLVHIRGAGRNPANIESNYWAVWVSFRPFRVAAATPGDYLGFLLTRAVASGQIKRFIRCKWEGCRKFAYMKRARIDMHFCSPKCKNKFHWYTS